ncbi:MAG: hypothetical protein MPN21_22100 [Thermoanaerobaculia bacterium]|nr:hypothetical protein [Thermoanaerobaculia bacterium]
MGILSGSAAVTRFTVPALTDEPDFEAVRFREIEPGSETRESAGFVPAEPDAPWEVGARRWFFRLRIDTVRPDPTAVQERVKEMVRAELDQGAEFVGSKKRKKMKELAEEELIFGAQPRSKIVECCIDGETLYVGSTAKNILGRVAETMRRIHVPADLKAPWVDRGDPDIESPILETYEPGESLLGARFLRALIGDREILFEPESGLVKLRTEDARVTLGGSVLKDLVRYVERGCEVLSAKLISGDPAASFTLDGLSFRVSSLRVETSRHDHWTEQLDERLGRIAEVYGLLERKYEELAPRLFHV